MEQNIIAIDDGAYEVEFMHLVVDKADNLKVVDSDSHFRKFTGVHPSKIDQGKMFLHDFIKPVYREKIMKILCKKNSPYVYFEAEFFDKNGTSVFIYCTGQNWDNSTLCRLTLADVSKSQLKQEQLKQRAMEMDHLIDLVTGGVCLFKVTSDLHIEPLYLNEGGCKLFGTTKNACKNQLHRLDELIHPEDKSLVFQAIGRAMATNDAIDIEFRTIVHKDEYRWCKFNAAIQSYDEDKNPVFHAMFTDITSVKEAEEKADLLNEQLIKMFKNVPTPVFSTSTEEPLILNIVSEDFMKFMGYSRSFLFDEHGGNLADFMIEREVKYVEANIKKQIKENSVVKIRYSLRVQGGKFVTVEDNRKIVDQDDGTKSMLCSLKNVTQSYYDNDTVI
ncbi:MAG: PAS domain-containing protein [Eubacterium sp.]|nr:PAS domain-containing protein [Eubacterium sp.]